MNGRLLTRWLLTRRPLTRGLFLLVLLAVASRTEAAVTVAVTANRLVVTGDDGANQITVRSIPFNANRLEVLNGNVSLGTFVRNTFGSIEVNGLGGNDILTLSGPFPIIEPARIDGGPGSDTIKGGAANDTLLGGDGDDRFIWSAIDGVDLIDGEDGADRLELNGSSLADEITVVRIATTAVFNVGIGVVHMNVDSIEDFQVFALGGDDKVTATGVFASTLPVITLLIDGGPGNDILSGSDGPDVIKGGDGNDQLHGLEGGDTLIGGPGDDDFFWRPGDGDDDVQGDEGLDRFTFSGDNVNENITIQQSGSGARIRRDPGNITIDLLRVEQIHVLAHGGVDRIAIEGDLADAAIDIDTGAGADVIETTASARVNVNGGADVDRLTFNAFDLPISLTPTTIAVAGVTRLTHTQVEDVRFSRLIGSLPTIAISSPTTDPATSATTTFLSVAGTATDADGTDGIASVSVTNDRGGGRITAAGTTAGVTRDVPLAGGTNVLTATVRDTAGNEISDTLTVTVNAFTYSMAEGATGNFFDTDILIANPNSVAAPVTIAYLRGDGVVVPQSLTLAPTSRATIRVDEIPGLETAEVSATVTSTAALPLVVERTMRWDATGYGSHTEKATGGAATTWLFAEGAQGFFDTYLLLANPQNAENTATVTFLVENGAPVIKTFKLAPTSRRTIPASSIPEVVNQSFGIAVTFTLPGAAERAMYFGVPVFNAGHESAGVNEASTSWFLAEGATGSFFTTFVLLANPGLADARATVTFLPEGGTPVTKTKTVPAGSRVTLNIAGEDASLASVPVATAVESTQPILVERAQYWPFTPDRWYEAHNSFGSTAVASKWGLAEGRVGGPEGYQTFILLANGDTTRAADVRITFLRANGTTVMRSFTVAPASRLTVRANEVTELANEPFGALIEVTSGPGIFVERALYSNAQGVTFAAGTNALATRLP
jgi:hypothetical protein